MVDPDLITAVEQQLSSPDTPYVARCHERLIAEHNLPSEEAVEMIAHCLADELDTLQSEQRDFNVARYQLLLGLLPTMPEA